MTLSLKNFSLLYFAVTAIHLLVLVFELNTLHLIVKPLFMPILTGMLYQLSTDRTSSFYKLMQFGLLFSWFGDIALMLDRENPLLFIIGLSAFLIAHLGYATAFIGSIKKSSATFQLPKAVLVAVPFMLFTALFFWKLQAGLGEMYIPVLAYTSVITLMGIIAALRAGHTESENYRIILFGAVLFILSDCVIAWNKFVVDFEYDQVLNMSLYLSGQYFLTLGTLKYLHVTSRK